MNQRSGASFSSLHPSPASNCCPSLSVSPPVRQELSECCPTAWEGARRQGLTRRGFHHHQHQAKPVFLVWSSRGTPGSPGYRQKLSQRCRVRGQNQASCKPTSLAELQSLGCPCPCPAGNTSSCHSLHLESHSELDRQDYPWSWARSTTVTHFRSLRPGHWEPSGGAQARRLPGTTQACSWVPSLTAASGSD